jgi:uncharacterized membrane protein (Fun14 family)
MSYEFTEAENGIFRGLVSGMKRSGMTLVFASLIFLAYQIVEYFGIHLGKGETPKIVGQLDMGLWCALSLVGVLVAVLLIQATVGFVAVINTQGDDIKHLMEALTRLQGILKLLFIAALVGSIMLTASFLMLLFA